MSIFNKHIGLALFITFFTIGLISIIYLYPDCNFPDVEKQTYITITFLYCVIGICMLYAYWTKGVYFFEPIVLITAMYLAIFVFMPIHDIHTKDTLQFGKYVMGGGVKATIIVTISYLSLFICYYYKNEIYGNVIIEQKKSCVAFLKAKSIVKAAVVIWFVSFLLYTFYTVSTRGLSLTYIFTLGFSGMQSDSLLATSPLAFLNKFGNALAIPYLYIYIFSKNKILKIIIFTLTMIVYFINGSRYIMIIFLAGPIIYHYTKKNASPSIYRILIALFILLLGCAFIASMRTGMRTGQGSSAYNQFTIDNIFDPFYSNFTLYKTFYGAVEAFPREHPYQLGRGMIIGTIILFIPRALWAAKPSEAIGDYIEWSINKRARISGLAYNNIGEYYVEFGIIGCIVFMGLLGWACRKMKRLYENPQKDVNSLVLYSALYPCVFSIINAGWTPMNFYSILFTIFPWCIIKKYSK